MKTSTNIINTQFVCLIVCLFLLLNRAITTELILMKFGTDYILNNKTTTFNPSIISWAKLRADTSSK